MSRAVEDAARHLEWVAGVRREKMDEAAHWTDMTRDAVHGAIEAGVSEVKAAQLAGVSRPTVRSWLGKDKG